VAGVVPKGSSDTFGLRRQGNGIVRILVDKGISTNARPLVLIVLDQLSYGDATLQTHTTKANALADDIVSFIRERVGFYLESVEGLEYDIVRAALGAHEASWNLLENDPLGIVERSRALMKARATDGFVKLCGAAKRIRNILSKSADSPDSLGWYFEESLFNSEEEKRLGQATQEVESAAQSLARNGQYVAAFAEITKLADPIGSFFDAVLVMAEESRIRSNRLRLLNRLNRVFSAIADLSQIVVE
jgi:glycyl-tRNA synthetase beta chain